MALSTLKNLPAHTSLEVLTLFGSLTTCDPGDINETIKTLKSTNVRVSIVGLAAEMRICRQICKETGGEYNVLLDDHHLKQLIMALVQPPVAGGNTSHASSLNSITIQTPVYYTQKRCHGIFISKDGISRRSFYQQHKRFS